MALQQDTEVTQTQSEIVTSEPVLRRVVDALHLYDEPVDYEKDFASPLKKKIIGLEARMYRAQLGTYAQGTSNFHIHYQRALEMIYALTLK